MRSSDSLSTGSVGSSMSSTEPPFRSVRAMHRRCFSPPEKETPARTLRDPARPRPARRKPGRRQWTILVAVLHRSHPAWPAQGSLAGNRKEERLLGQVRSHTSGPTRFIVQVPIPYEHRARRAVQPGEDLDKSTLAAPALSRKNDHRPGRYLNGDVFQNRGALDILKGKVANGYRWACLFRNGVAGPLTAPVTRERASSP